MDQLSLAPVGVAGRSARDPVVARGGLSGAPGRLAIAASAAAAGAACAFAAPPWSVLPGLLGYAVMFRLVDGAGASPRPLRAAFLRAWLAGLGYFLVSLWWIADPFLVDAKDQGWMAPIAVPVVAAGMALFWGAAGAVYRWLAGRGVTRLLLFAGAMAGAEWLRGHVLTGFPWDLPGETWKAGSAASQAAALIGVYGLTWITLAAAAAPGLIAEGAAGALTALAGVLAVLVLIAGGEARLAVAAAVSAGPGAPVIRIVQADVPEAAKNDPAMLPTIVARYLLLTERPAARRPQVVVWSEGAIPAPLEDYLAPGAWTYEAISRALSPDQTLLVGGYRFAEDRRGRPAAFNAMAVVRSGAEGPRVLAVYDKYRLVPFGEFMPLAPLARRLGIEQLVHVGDGFSPGPRPRPLRVEGLPPFQPLICYESLFPAIAHAGARAAHLRPAWIVNLSNDSWFGDGSGPVQLLNLASYRAIEEGLPMIRATPTGYSAVIDAFGRVVPGKILGEGAYGVIDARLPAALAPTPYSKWGDGPFFVILAASAVGVGRKRRDRT